jgi:hypothetical protein
VRNFEVDHDRLDLSAFGPRLDLQRLMARSVTDGDDMTLKLRGREIMLLDVGAGALDDHDFLM